MMKRNDGHINSVLLTHNGIGHGSFSDPNDCTLTFMKSFIISGYVPHDGMICNSVQSLFPDTGSRESEDVELAKKIFHSLNPNRRI
jgi:hypothetical protein